MTAAADPKTEPHPEDVRVGIAACLLGQRVRYDGGHKRHPFIADSLRDYVTLVPVCPEVEIGLGVPREPLELVLGPEGLRLTTTRTREDLTERMSEWANRKAEDLAKLSGYIFKSRSPSCGLVGVPIHSPTGRQLKSGSGMFAGRFLSQHPQLPVEEEARLHDPLVCEQFLIRVFAFHRLERFFRTAWDLSSLRRFHTNESFLLLAQPGAGAARLERLLKRSSRLPAHELASRYKVAFMNVLSRSPTRRRHIEILRRLAACLVDTVSRVEIDGVRHAIADFGKEKAARWRSILEIRRLAERYQLRTLWAQSYLRPFPEGLMRSMSRSS